MELAALLSTAFAAAALIFAVVLLRRRSLAGGVPPLPPGPGGLPVVGHFPFLDPELHTYFTRLAAVHGPIFSLHLGSMLNVVVSSPDLAREILREKDSAFANRVAPESGIVITSGADILWSPAGPMWRMLRRACAQEMLTPAGLAAMSGLRRRELRATVGDLYGRAGTAVDLRSALFTSACNVMTSMVWGSTLPAAPALGKTEFREFVAEIVDISGWPNVSDYFPALAPFDLQGIRRKTEKSKKMLDEMFGEIIDGRRRERKAAPAPEKPKDFLDYLLAMEEEGGDGKTPFTMDNVKAVILDIIVGGSDTNAVVLEWAIAELMYRPEILGKVHEELDAVVGRERAVEESDTPRLPYLAAVIKETLRLHPATPFLVRTPGATGSALGATVGAFSIPKGTRVFLNIWAMQRDPNLWKDPLEFRPERFLAGDDKQRRDECDYLPFGSGRRMCLGMPLAEKMLPYTLASLLHSFEWRLPAGTLALDLKEKFGIVLRKATALSAIPVPRLAGDHLYQ